MGKLFIDDASRTDNRAKITTAKLASLNNIITPKAKFIEFVNNREFKVLAPLTVSVGKNVFDITEDITVNLPIDLELKTNYYVYLCDNGNKAPESIAISKNATYPNNYNFNTSRKIGGFYYDSVRVTNSNLVPLNDSNIEWGTGWEDNVEDGIVPRSIWTILHRPKCAPEGMVYIGGGVWVDIYLSSDDGNSGLTSIYNTIPISGNEGENWYTLNEKALITGKRFISYAEWCKAAFGSPVNTTVKTFVNTTKGSRSNTGFYNTGTEEIITSPSSIGCIDCVGNLWEFLDEMIATPTDTINWNYYDSFTDTSKVGYLYSHSKDGLSSLCAGGCYSSMNNAGSRSMILINPWLTRSDVGVRLGCNSI